MAADNVGDGRGPMGLRWQRALNAYAASVAAELHNLRVPVIDWFVDVRDVPFSIELSAVNGAKRLVEFYFFDDVGWMHCEGDRCGRLITATVTSVRDRAAEVALPATRVAAEIVRALDGDGWAADPPVAGGAQSEDPYYLLALLDALEASSVVRKRV